MRTRTANPKTKRTYPLSREFTTTIPLQTRQLAPVTLTRAVTKPTTGKGHQDARPATGSLTLYNGLFTPQPIPSGTVFTSSDGIKVVTDASVTVPASNPTANPPQLGYATVPANAVVAGSSGNIAAYDINATVVNGVSVKNTSPFAHGQDARDFQAVVQRDLDSLTAQVQQQLTQAIPRLSAWPQVSKSSRPTVSLVHPPITVSGMRHKP